MNTFAHSAEAFTSKKIKAENGIEYSENVFIDFFFFLSF